LNTFLGIRIGWDDYSDNRLAVAQGTLLWQPVINLGDVRRRRQERPQLFALASYSGFVDREAVFKRLDSNNPATSCTNLVNFRPIISEFTLLKRAIFAAIRPQFDDDLHSSRNGLEDRNFDFSRVIGNHFCTTCRKLVIFGSVTPEFNT